MQKPKEYRVEGSNMEHVNSDLDKKVKKEAAKGEPAWKPAEKAKAPALFVWRIEKFKVIPWPTELYGKFHEGDSYIILNVYKDHEKGPNRYDLHFWIGSKSTADEYGTAAYKTVELFTLLDCKPVQHREVQNSESDLMRRYFTNIEYLEGGIESGFRTVKKVEFVPHLYCISTKIEKKKPKSQVADVVISRNVLDDNCSYVLDLGEYVYAWHGKNVKINRKYNVTDFLNNLTSTRNTTKKVHFNQGDKKDDKKFYDLLEEAAKKLNSNMSKNEPKSPNDWVMLQLNKKNEFVVKATGDQISRGLIKDSGVYVIDIGSEIFFYIGKELSKEHQKNGLTYAQNYVKQQDTKAPITIVLPNSPSETRERFRSMFRLTEKLAAGNTSGTKNQATKQARKTK